MASVTIGRGGAGPDSTAPECRCCYARGGGSHGGLCPNAGRPEDSWLSEPPAHMERPERDSPSRG